MEEGDASTSRAPRGAVTPSRLRAALPVGLLAVLIPTMGVAQEIDGFVELGGARSSQTTTVNAGLERETKASSFSQRYSLNFTWTPYPHMRLALGGLFERDDTLDDGSSGGQDTTRDKLRPYVSLSLGSGMFAADLGLYRLQDSVSVQGFDARTIRDTANATLTWRPDRLPEWRLTMVRTDSHDADRRSLNIIDTLADLSFRYTPVRPLEIFYRGGIQTNDNRIDETELKLWSHAGRLTYSDVFWERRLLLSGEYNVNYQKQEIQSNGGGEVIRPVFPTAGISVNDDFPANVVLAANPALTDGDRAASAGINLGLPPPGGDDTLRNIGLDLTLPANVDTLRLWVDRVLPPEISSFFVWQIYTSTDNQNWVSQGTATAVFGSFDTRFELRFNDLSARYLKVVTAPLDLTNASATQFPVILVTELEAFDRSPADDVPVQPGLATHRLNTNLRAKLLPNRSFFYDLSYSTVRPDLGMSTYVVSNALSYNQQINRVAGVSARVARDDGREGQGKFVSYPYTASVRANWLSTLRQSLVFSGVRSSSEQYHSAFDSIFLQTSADLYRGISAELGLGTSRRTTDDEETKSNQLTGSMALLPHPTLTVNLLYQLRRNDRAPSATGQGLESDFQAAEVDLSYRPFPSLYLFGSYRREFRTDTPDLTLMNYNIGWTPFPSGSLQITLRYDETYRSQLDTTSAISSASIRWNLRKGRYVEAGYVNQRLDTSVDQRKFDSLQASLRWPF